MSGTVTITADEAADTARSIRDDVSHCYQHGTLTDFARGMYQSHLTMVQVYMRPESGFCKASRTRSTSIAAALSKKN